MNQSNLRQKADHYLRTLCTETPYRSAGSQANQKATEYFQSIMQSSGLQTETQEFTCMDWKAGEVDLSAGGQRFQALVSPYSLGAKVSAPLRIADSPGTLEAIQCRGEILLLHGALSKEQLMPKNFVFYNPEEHQKIYRLLEEKAPRVILTATAKNPDLAGALYPFPMIEDGDFGIPTAHLTEVEGEKLKALSGRNVQVSFESRRIPSTGRNVIARTGQNPAQRIVVCAHIDTKETTPGALDDGAGCVVLLLLAELLKDYRGDPLIELVALNGEEYYAASGQMKYLEINRPILEQIKLAVNLDDLGYKKGRTAYSLYNCDHIAGAIHSIWKNHEELIPGEQWYQGDHMIFAMNQRPAMAITSENMAEMMAEITHTEKDVVDLADFGKLVSVANALRDLITRLGKTGRTFLSAPGA